MSWDGLQGSEVTYADSPAESARFGLPMARLTVGWEAARQTDGRAAAEVTERLRTSAADVVVVRYPAQALELAAAVARSGRSTLPAGSLTYWSAAASDIISHVKSDPGDARHVPGAAEGLTVRSLADHPGGDRERAEVVDAVVADSFGGYGNHYSANPMLDPSAALAGYQEWARRSALADPDDALLLLLHEEVVGLATLTDGEEPDPHVEVLLAGLRTAAQGRGRYATLFGGVARATQARDRPQVVISTQSHNVRVQRAWARLGLRPFAAVETVHAVRPGVIT